MTLISFVHSDSNDKSKTAVILCCDHNTQNGHWKHSNGSVFFLSWLLHIYSLDFQISLTTHCVHNVNGQLSLYIWTLVMNSSLKIRTTGNVVQIGHLLLPQPTTEAITCCIQSDCTRVCWDKGKAIKWNNLVLWHYKQKSLLFHCWARGRNVLFELALFNSGAACAQHARVSELAQGPFAPGLGTSDTGPPGQGAGILTPGTSCSLRGRRGWHRAHGEHQTDRGLPNSLWP